MTQHNGLSMHLDTNGHEVYRASGLVPCARLERNVGVWNEASICLGTGGICGFCINSKDANSRSLNSFAGGYDKPCTTVYLTRRKTRRTQLEVIEADLMRRSTRCVESVKLGGLMQEGIVTLRARMVETN